MKPPYGITSRILKLVSSISEKIGEVNSAHLNKPPTELRKKNRIKTIQSSLEIEGNAMTVKQITDLLDEKRVIAPQKDILEVKNAIEVYDKLDKFNLFDINSLLSAHKVLMKGLIESAGRFRTTSVGIVKGERVGHIAPPGKMVHALIKSLLSYLENDDDLLLIKSCVFHYEFEFIHPFLDGNGRMGRLWQTLILREYSPVFEFLPIETLIKERQHDYYSALSKSDNQGHSTLFIEFILQIINTSLEELLRTQKVTLSQEGRILHFRKEVGNSYFTRQDYLRIYKGISQATASRDLKEATEKKVIEKIGDKRTTKYKFIE